MMAAIYDGVFNSNLSISSSALQPTCPSGNCTSTPYASLGVCSRCTDITSKLKYHFKPDSLGNVNTWTLPNGHMLMNADTAMTSINISSSSLDGNFPAPMLLNSNDLDAYQSAGTFSNISIIGMVSQAEDLGGGEFPNDTIAHDCTLFFCARSYISSSTLHVFQENVTGVFDQPEWSMTSRQMIEAYATPLVTFEAPATALSNLQNRSLVFGINGTAVIALWRALGSITGSVGTDVAAETVITNDLAQGFYLAGVSGDAVNSTVSNVASALTNVLRQSAGSRIPGTALALEPYIAVQWLWLLLPLVIIVLALVVLGSTIFRTKRSGVPNWRTNALATMAHGIYGMSTAGPCGYEAGEKTLGELENWAQALNVKLQRRASGALAFHLELASHDI
jgi:hypothetical protein